MNASVLKRLERWLEEEPQTPQTDHRQNGEGRGSPRHVARLLRVEEWERRACKVRTDGLRGQQ